jgi:hypothetical protein
MTHRWNNVETEEKDESNKKMKKWWKDKNIEIPHLNQDILKIYDKMKRWQND